MRCSIDSYGLLLENQEPGFGSMVGNLPLVTPPVHTEPDTLAVQIVVQFGYGIVDPRHNLQAIQE